MEFLIEVDREVDFIVLHATGQWGTLPPVLRTVDGVLRRVILVRIGRITHIANLSLDDLGVLVLVVVVRVCTDEFTVQLGSIGVHTARGGGSDFATLGQIEVRWCQLSPHRSYQGQGHQSDRC